MADFTALKTAIQTYIKQNGNEEITGEKLQEILLSMVTTLGDSAINALITALNDEVAARQNADGTLQQNITNEATARGNADTALGGRIDDEETARASGDTALSNRLGSTITAEDTAADQIGAEAEARTAADTALLELIDGITDNIENGYVYAGIATPSSTPATGKVFYLALTAGTYTNFGNIEVSQGINILKYNGSAWSLDAFIGIDDTPTPNSPKLVKSGGAFESVMANGSAFDISAHFASGGTLATYANLTAALTALDTLSADYKRGGMSIKFVQSSDNNYVQFRCVASEFTTDTTQWAIDDAGIYVENSEFIKVYTDSEDKILWAIKTNGDIYFGAGVPTQIKDYIQSKISELSLDEYEDIVTFLGNLIEGDTLATLLNAKANAADLDTKVDKVTGKSLIDEEYAEDVHYIENPEFDSVWLDAEDKVLFGVQTDGNFLFGYGVPRQVKEYIEQKIEELSLDEYEDIVAFLNDYLGSDTTLKVLIDSKLDAEGLNPNGLSSIQAIDTPEFFDVTTDENGKVLEGITVEGTKQINIPLKLKDVSFENSNGDVLNLNQINLSESGVDSLKDDLGLNTETHAVNTVSYLKYGNINEQRGLFSIQMDTNPDNNISGYLNMLQVLREYGLMSMDFAINITALQSPYINKFLELQNEGCEIIYHNRINSPSDFSENSSLTVEEAKAGVCAERLAFTQKGFTTFGVVANNGSVGERYKPMLDSLFYWSEYGSKQPHQAYQNTKSQYLTDHRIIRTGFDMTDTEYETPGFEEQEINYAKAWIDNLCTNKTFGVMYCHFFEGTSDVYRLHKTTLRAIAAYIVEKINNGELYYGSTTECLNLLCK